MEKEEGCGSIATVSVVEDGVKVILGPLYLSYQDGDYIESSGYATKALEKSLKRLLKKYPDVSYEGYIAYRWSDVHCGEAEQWEISSNNKLDNNANKIYPILGEMLGFSMSDTEFWGQMLENLEDGDVDDFKHVLSNLYTYKKWIPEDSIEQLMDIADEVDEDIRSELEDALELLQNGEDIIAKENIDTSCLPDGYMDVLNAVIQSEDASKNAEIDAELEDEDEE